MSPRAELLNAVFQLVQAYRRGVPAVGIVLYVKDVVDVWEKHPREELREIMGESDGS